MELQKPLVEFRDVSKRFGSFEALKSVNARVERGEVVVICGPSGSGKTTLIRTLNRLESIDTGSIWVDGIDIHSPKSNVNDLRSRIGFVFQQFNLFPHLSVRDNVALGPIKVKGIPAAIAQKRARDFLHRVGLESQIDKYPPQLSGGQQQRVAIARALAMEPPMILFDEPTSSLDPEMIGEVLSVMKSLAHTGITMICVTHEMGFASDVADRVWFMSDGQLIEDSPAATFFKRPKHSRAQEFLQHLR